jgi:hypothetical protein
MRAVWIIVAKIGRWRLLCPPLLLVAAGFIPDNSAAKGGTNMHERASAVVAATFQPTLPTKQTEGCERARYRDRNTHNCRGPAHFGN